MSSGWSCRGAALLANVCLAACTDGSGKPDACTTAENPFESDTRFPPCTDGRRWEWSGGSDSYCFAYANHACEESPVDRPMRLAAYTFFDDRGYPPASNSEVQGAFGRAVDAVNALGSGTGARYTIDYSTSMDVEPEEGFRVADDGWSMVGMGGVMFQTFMLQAELARTICTLDDPFTFGDCDLAFRPSVRVELAGGAGAMNRQVEWVPWTYQLPDPNEYHMQSAMAHELGHVLGLAHSPATGLLDELATGEILEANCDDRRAVYFLYCQPTSESQLCDDAEISRWACPS